MRGELDTSSATLAAVLHRRACAHGRDVAYSFLTDGEGARADLSYAALHARARAIAAAILDRCRPGDRALLVHPPGLAFIEAFFACLHAGVVAVPVFPPDPLRPEASATRLATIAEDASVTCVLTTDALAAALAALGSGLGGVRQRPWISTDTLDVAGRERVAPDRHAAPGALAVLQYTSGSTGRPKGVMLTHGNLLAQGRICHRIIRGRPHEIVVGWLPPYHDMGLIGTVLYPMQAGYRSILMSPLAFLQRPLRWLRAISDHRATASVAPNFGYELCVRKITAEEAATLDLRSWRMALNGAERVRLDTMRAFADAFAPAGFRARAFLPCYGLAEATLMVSGGPQGAEPVAIADADGVGTGAAAGVGAAGREPLVGSGAPAPGQCVRIVHPGTRASVPAGAIGEIWVAGPCVGRGYWRQPEETARTFHARVLDGPAGGYLRTGDLGFLHRGQLVVVGRLKDLIVIRGVNHYPDDVEQTARRSHPDLRPGGGAAFGVDVRGVERLVVVHELARDDVDPVPVLAALRAAIASTHQVHVGAATLVRARSVPKTSSGKVRRRACREQFLAGTLDALAEWRSADLGGMPAPPPARPARAPVARTPSPEPEIEP